MTIRADRRGLLRRAALTRQALPFSLDRFYAAGLPDAALWTGAQVHVLDETGGAVTCFSDGTNWRRITDLTIVSSIVSAGISSTGEGECTLNAVIGPYIVSTGVATGTFAASSYIAAAISADGEASVTLDMLGGIAECAMNFTGAGTATFVGDFGEGELSGIDSTGAGTATFATLTIGTHAALSVTGANISLFRGATA